MKYTITAVKRTAIPKRDGSGTWNKIEVKTAQTGADVYELGNGISKQLKDSIKSGMVIEGYTENAPWMKSDGTPGGFNKRLNGITVEFLYALIQKLHPELSGGSVVVPSTAGLAAAKTVAPVPVDEGWEGEENIPPANDDIGF